MIENDWATFLEKEFSQTYFKQLSIFVEEEYRTKVIYPPKDTMFECFALTDYPKVKVVILGQDPYHQPNQSHGLCFSVCKSERIPPSLRNIFKELQDDLQVAAPSHGNLAHWAKQGVLLLNAVLSVEHGKPNSHQHKGWEIFSDHVLEELNRSNRPIVFILWGAKARSKRILLSNSIHCVIESAHPSPLSAWQNFFGTKPFSRANRFLIETNQQPIVWEDRENFYV